MAVGDRRLQIESEFSENEFNASFFALSLRNSVGTTDCFEAYTNETNPGFMVVGFMSDYNDQAEYDYNDMGFAVFQSKNNGYRLLDYHVYEDAAIRNEGILFCDHPAVLSLDRVLDNDVTFDVILCCNNRLDKIQREYYKDDELAKQIASTDLGGGKSMTLFRWDEVVGSNLRIKQYYLDSEGNEIAFEEYGEAVNYDNLIALVQAIAQNPDCAASSNPFDFIEAKRPLYNEIISYGSSAVDCFVEQLRSGENGLQGYIMAVACADITGIGDKDTGADWATAQEWLALYEKSDKSTIIPPVIATDYISGQQARLLSFSYTSEESGQSVIACGIAPYQAEYDDGNTLVLDGRHGENQIILAPSDFSFSRYKIYLPDGTVYDDGTRAAFDSLALRIMVTEKGVCLIAPFQKGEYIYEVELTWPEMGLTATYGLKVVMTGEDNNYDRALDSVFAAYSDDKYPLMSVTLIDKYSLGNAVSSSARYLFKVDNVPNGPIYVEVSQSTGEIIAEVDDPQQWLVDPPVGEQSNVSGDDNEGQQMTLADVVELSKLGMKLTWEDLREYTGKDIGSGLYVVRFDIDPEFYLLVGDGKTTGEPMYAFLNAVGSGASCDIRESDVESFIQENQNDALDNAIHKAVIEHNAGDRFKPDGLISAESHYILGITSKSATPLAGQTNHMEEMTVYVHYVYHRYANSKGELESAAGISTPAAITFSYDPDTGYTLKEFWEPNHGSTFSQDIREKFPAEIADIVLDPQDDTVNTDELETRCLAQAQEYVSSLTN